MQAGQKGKLSPEQTRVADLALLSAARLLYAGKRFKLAVKYYDRVPASSRYRTDALFEQSWARFRLGDHVGALAVLRRARGTGPDPNLWESYLLEALIYHESCRYRRSAALAHAFVASHGGLPDALDGLLRKHQDPQDLHDLVLKLRAERGSPAGVRSGARNTDLRDGKSGLQGAVEQSLRAALVDPALEKRLAQEQEIVRELRLVQSAPAAWRSRAVAGAVLQELTLQASLVKSEVGQLARQLEAEAGRRARGKAPAGCDRLRGVR